MTGELCAARNFLSVSTTILSCPTKGQVLQKRLGLWTSSKQRYFIHSLDRPASYMHYGLLQLLAWSDFTRSPPSHHGLVRSQTLAPVHRCWGYKSPLSLMVLIWGSFPTTESVYSRMKKNYRLTGHHVVCSPLSIRITVLSKERNPSSWNANSWRFFCSKYFETAIFSWRLHTTFLPTIFNVRKLSNFSLVSFL